jgi:2-oxoglutarate ferredoxin oxidoreductase subunit alpha
VPVIILTDQYFLDSRYHTSLLDLSRTKIEPHITRTHEEYRRYAFTENGVSPRGIPGHGDGLVVVAGNEHDEDGHLTEDGGLRRKMVEKRLRKLDSLQGEVVRPDLVGRQDYRTLVVGWGSTYHAICEALEELGRDDISFLHFKQVYPLHEATSEHLQRADRVAVVESNATAQFARHIKLTTGFEIDHRILKYDGRPFSVEEIVAGLREIIG